MKMIAKTTKLAVTVLLVCTFQITTVFGQTPEKMTYQAVVRDASNNLVTSTQVGIEINIYQGSTSGTLVYEETQTPTTNANGLLSIEIGGQTGFDLINWANGPYFIETNIDITGGMSYTITGVSQLLTVPYALHAKTAETITGGITETDPIYSSSIVSGITSTNITNWNSAYSWGDHSTSGYLTSSIWTQTGDDIYFNTGNTAIGTTLPNADSKLYVYRPQSDTGAGKSGIYSYRSGNGDGVGWTSSGVDAAIKGYSYYGNNYSAGIAAYSYHDYNNSTAFIAAKNDGTSSALLSYKDLNGDIWSGYFNGNINIIGDIYQNGVLFNGSETDPIFTSSQANNITATDITNLSNLSGTNTGNQDISGIAENTQAIQDTASQIRADFPNVSSFITVETDPIFATSQANNITAADITNLSNLSGTNTGNQDISGIAENTQAIQDTASQIRADFPNVSSFITTEIDPIFTAWDKTTGIAITESQITDLQNYLVTEVDGSIDNEIQDLQLNGNILTITNNGIATEINLSAYLDNTDTQLTDAEISTMGYIKNADDADADTSNEIQSLSISSNELTISGTGGNTVTLPSSASGNMQVITRAELDALTPEVGELAYNTTDQVTLMWNGTNWIQLSDNCFPQPTTANAGSNQTVNTTATTVTLAANTPIEGTGTWSVISGTGGSFTDIHDPTTTFSGTFCTDYTLQWEIATVCSSTSTNNVNILFSTPPTIANAGEDIYDPTPSGWLILAGNNPTIGTGTWSKVSGPSTLSVFDDPNSYNTMFSYSQPGIYTLRWTTSTGCNTTYDDVKLYIGDVVGQYKYGGVIFYVDGGHGLVCAVNDQSTGTEWGCNGTIITGADGIAVGTGAQNTIDIETGCTTNGTAADICDNLTLNGYNDWFLPSKDELALMNQNTVEISISAVKNGGSNFAPEYYWSSTEYDNQNDRAWCSWLSSITPPTYSPKNIPNRVRAVRAF